MSNVRRLKRRKQRSETAETEGGSFFGNFSPFAASSPVPSRFITKMKYVSFGSLTSGTAGVVGGQYVFRLNSVYDPDQTGAGHQPYGFDQLAALYGKYLVRRVDVTIVFSNPSADGAAPCMSLTPANSGPFGMAGLTAEAVAEKPQCRVGLLNNTGSQRITWKVSFDIAKIEGLSKIQYEAETGNYGASISANPSLTPYVAVALADVTQTGGLTVQFGVELNYHVEFYERAVLGQS